jgi:catechol 2,3-dioxygenase-like lactoylglutathione lyase family enzyme
MTWRPVPILPMSDPAATQQLYTRLGFAVVDATPEGQSPYLIAERDGGELHFCHQPDVDPLRSGFSCYLEVDDVDQVYGEWARQVPDGRGHPRLVAPEDKPWGLREMAFVDGDGTLLRLATRPDPQPG